MQKPDIKELASKLTALGEDTDELNLWVSIYEDLEPGEQEELVSNLQDELRKLERIGGVNRK